MRLPQRITFWLIICVLLPAPAAAGASADSVLIQKGERRLTLLKGDQVIAEYSIALGGSPEGAKRCQGDNKTPEGSYRISGRNEQSAFYRSLRISYPSKADRKKSKAKNCPPGGDIMIHGLPNGRGWIGRLHRLSDWTQGCIAVTNSEMDELWDSVPIGTKVEIVP